MVWKNTSSASRIKSSKFKEKPKCNCSTQSTDCKNNIKTIWIPWTISLIRSEEPTKSKLINSTNKLMSSEGRIPFFKIKTEGLKVNTRRCLLTRKRPCECWARRSSVCSPPRIWISSTTLLQWSKLRRTLKQNFKTFIQLSLKRTQNLKSWMLNSL